MNEGTNVGRMYFCPMHRDVKQTNPGKCPKCSMDLLPEGTRFAMLRHMTKNPMMIIGMVAIMVAVMAFIMLRGS